MLVGWEIILLLALWSPSHFKRNIKRLYQKPLVGRKLSRLIVNELFCIIGVFSVFCTLYFSGNREIYLHDTLIVMYAYITISALLSLAANQLGKNKLTKLSHS